VISATPASTNSVSSPAASSRSIVLHELVPAGALGGVRVLAFAAMIAGAFLLAPPERRAATADTTPGGIERRHATASDQ